MAGLVPAINAFLDSKERLDPKENLAGGIRREDALLPAKTI
jgi:hypothetical protein